MRKLLVSALLLFTPACSHAAPNTYEEAQEAVVAIGFVSDAGVDDPVMRFKSFCSGVVIHPGVILTNKHCTSIDKNRPLVLQFHNGATTHAVVVGVGKTVDAAILSFDPRFTLRTVQIAMHSNRVGDHVFAVGMPQGYKWTVTFGRVSNPDQQLPDDPFEQYGPNHWLQFDAAVNGGNSGGGLFDESGFLIGIVTLKNYRAEGIGMAIPIDKMFDAIKEFL